MKSLHFWLIAGAIIASGVVSVFLTRPTPLSIYEWRYTPVLIFSPSLKDIRLPDQIRKLSAHSLEFRRRAMVIISIVGLEPVTADRTAPPMIMPESLRREYGVKDNEFFIIVLDIDGTELYRREVESIRKVIKSEDLLAVADAATTRRNVAKWGPKPVRGANQKKT